jgi:cytochrome c peroxidase
MKYFFLVSIFLTLNLKAEVIDDVLKKHIDFFEIKPLPKLIPTSNRALYNLGKHLFIAPIISGNRNINCLTCHDPMMGTSDNKRLSQTHNQMGILKRNSQSLFNTGLPTRVHMFWDGRVSFNPEKKTFQTPEVSFNGENPIRSDITKNMTSALAMQVIFPMVSLEEMKGSPGENEIANAKNNLEAWDLIMARLLKHKIFRSQLELAYPGVTQFNIGHVGEALAQFISEEFYSNGSPFHQYIAGNINALSPRQKEGMRVFIERGNCIACHQSGELGLNTFYASVGVPQYGAKPFSLDTGRGNIKGEEFKKYWFRTPSLLNLKVTGPYFHNGAYKTIREVINHYSNIKIFLDAYDVNSEDRSNLPVEIDVLNDQISNREIFNSIQAPFLRRGFNFTEDEKDSLEDFLTNGLMDPKFEIR